MKDLPLTARHYQIIESTFIKLQGSFWSLDTPVFLFDRCWLRLDKIKFDELKKRLPPDNSAEAPELIKYNRLLQEGHDRLIALQECWLEFGMEDFSRAIRNYWNHQDIGNNGWTFFRYLDTLNNYRKSFDTSSISIPLIVLGRRNSHEEHSIEWIVRADLHESIAIMESPLERK